eukprot:scaffold1514_cov113-Skeletonema_dohrnii-CCMP3373.AAC.1
MSGRNNSDMKAAGGFSLAGSLIGGHTNGGNIGRNKKDTSARLREGLNTSSSTAAPLSMSKSPVSSPDRSQTKQRSSHRRVASYRQSSTPKSPTRSPQKHKRSVSQDISLGGIKFPGLSLSPSTDSSDRHSYRSNSKVGESSTPQSPPAKTSMNKNFEEYYSAATPGYKNAFTVLSGVKESSDSNNNKSPSSSQVKKQTSAAAAAAVNNKTKSPKSAITQTTIDSSSPQKQQQQQLKR